jgi:hypothetical protein
MGKLLQTAIKYLLSSATQKTTWAGVIGLLITQFGCQLTGVQIDSLATICVNIASALLILIPGDLWTKLIKGIVK